MISLVKYKSEQILEQIGKNDLPLIMLAMKLGFSTHSAFTRAFKSRTGMTPGQWIQEKN
jgi:AraC-like DNA-binding protein